MKIAERGIYTAPSLLSDLKSCSNEGDLSWGRIIHAKTINLQHNSNLYVLTALITMYGKCNSIEGAHGTFDDIQNPDVVAWTALLLGYAENGNGKTALDLFSDMTETSCAPNSFTYVAVLKACTSLAINGGKSECLRLGRQIHAGIGCHLNLYVECTLIDMYSKCGSMVEARHVFDKMQNPNVVTWNALLLGYAENGEGLSALELFSKMKSAPGCSPDSVTYISALKACTCVAITADDNRKLEILERGREIHSEIGYHLNAYVQSTLIDTYAKCGSMVEARRVFDSIEKPNLVSWTALLLGYAENGEYNVALKMFSKMKEDGCTPDSVSYGAALKACTSLAVNGNAVCKGLERGKQIHSEISCHLDPCLRSTLIDMYSKCGSMVEARRVFDCMQEPNVVCWNALLLGYAECGQGHAVLGLFSKMKSSGCIPDAITYLAVFKACSLVGALILGRKFHSELSEFTTQIVTCLVDFYGKCGSMVEACGVFHLHSKIRGISTWNALLSGYSKFGDSDSVFDLFDRMQDEGLVPDAVTLMSLLLCCSHAGLVERAREYFDAIQLQYNVTPNIMHYNCMVDVLGRDNQLNEAMGMIWNMPCKPDTVTWMALLSACRKWKSVEIGKKAFEALVAIDRNNASAYVLMGQIYGSRGMWEERERLLTLRLQIGLENAEP